MRILSPPRHGGTAAILGGSLWIVFWTFHTLAHGPLNPAPPDGTFLGLHSMQHARIMMLVSPPFLLLGLGGVLHRLRGELGWAGRAGGALLALSLAGMTLFGAGVGSWEVYAGSVAGVCAGMVLLGASMLATRALPAWSRGVPLAVALLLPALAAARTPGSPLLGGATGYLLLESLGVVFGAGWIALGAALRSAWPGAAPSDTRSGRIA